MTGRKWVAGAISLALVSVMLLSILGPAASAIPEQLLSVSGNMTHTIKADADGGSIITPNGNVTVQNGNNMTFDFEPVEGFVITEILIDDTYSLTQEEIDDGTYTFPNVTDDHSIEVTSTAGPRDDVTMNIKIEKGEGYAEFSVDSGEFIRYTKTAAVPIGADVVVRAFANDGYQFDKWEAPNVDTDSVILIENVQGPLNLHLYFLDSNAVKDSSAVDESGFQWWIVCLLIIAALALLLIVLLWIRSGLFLTIEMDDEPVAGATVTYRIDKDGKTKNGTGTSDQKGRVRITAWKNSTVIILKAAADEHVAAGLPLVIEMGHMRELMGIVLK